MPQGGFSRDFQRIAALRQKADEATRKEEREKIKTLVINETKTSIDNRMKEMKKNIEEKLVDKQADSINNVAATIRERETLLWFLIWVNFISWAAMSFMAGFYIF